LSRRTLVLLGVLLPTGALAGPPYATDDPDPVPPGHWEVYVSSQHEVTRGGVTGAAPFVDVNFGAMPNVHLHAFAPLIYDRPAGGPTAYCPGDAELGAKIRVVQEGEMMPMVGIYPAVDFPTGNASKNLGAGHVRAFFPAWVQKSRGPWTTYGGAGYWLNRAAGTQDYWFFGAVLQRRLSERAAVGAELFDTTADRPGGRGNFRFNLGLVLDVTEHHHVLLSAGRSLVGDTRFQAYVGYQLTL
jgi:hypothetical protein